MPSNTKYFYQGLSMHVFIRQYPYSSHFVMPIDYVGFYLFILILFAVLFGDMQLGILGHHTYILLVSHWVVHDVVHLSLASSSSFSPHIHGVQSSVTS